MVSGPVALEMFSLSSNLRTSGGGKWMKDTNGVDGCGSGEALLPGGRVGRDCICWQNMRRGNLVNCEIRSVAVLLFSSVSFR